MDRIATNNALHTPTEKAREFADAPFGIIGLENSLARTLKGLVKYTICDGKTVYQRG